MRDEQNNNLRCDLSEIHRPTSAAWNLRPGDRGDLRGGDVKLERLAQFAFIQHGPGFLQAFDQTAGHRRRIIEALALAHRRVGNRFDWHRDVGEQLGIGVHYGADDRVAGLRPYAGRVPAWRADKAGESNGSNGGDGGDVSSYDLHKVQWRRLAMGSSKVPIPT